MSKMMLMIRVVVLLCFGILMGCSTSESPTIDTELDKENKVPEASWSIPKSEVLGPYSPFPLVTNSSFVGTEDVNYPDNHLTVLISLGPDELRAYPNAFIALYEVINNEFQDKKFAITHCPLTGSTTCWDRVLGEEILTVKASGYLFHDNIMPTDIETGTIWSQMLMRGVSGVYDGHSHGTYNVVETDWKTVRNHFPQAKVYNEVVSESEIGTDPETEPTNRDFYRYGILAGISNIKVHLFEYDLFETEGLKLVNAFITGKKVLVVGNKNTNFISSYFIENNRNYFVDESDSFTFKDDVGNTYNGMGLVIEGPDKDLQLESPKAYVASWQAWQDFFENFEIYE